MLPSSRRLLFAGVPSAAAVGCLATAAYYSRCADDYDDDDAGTSRAAATGARRRSPIVLFADLDGTLTGGKCNQGTREADGWRLRIFNDWWTRHEASRHGSILVYNTARSSMSLFDHLAARLAQEEASGETNSQLLVPEVLITGEGTEIRWCVDPEAETVCREAFRLDEEWDRRMRQIWRGPGGLGARTLRVCGAYDELCIPHLNDPGNTDGLTDGSTTEYRHAITVRGSHARAKRTVAAIAQALGPEAEVAEMEAWGPDPKPWLITVLPRVAGKAGAATYVRQVLGHDDDTDCIAAGDTMGDEPMLSATNMRFIMVGNAKQALVDAAAAAAAAAAAHGNRQSSSSSSPSSSYYHAVRASAGGVLEGLRHFGRRAN